MEVMRDMHSKGLLTDEYMRDLEEAHKRDQSLEAFGRFVDQQKVNPTPVYRASGGNKKRRPVAERIRKRKAQKAARRRTRA